MIDPAKYSNVNFPKFQNINSEIQCNVGQPI